MQSPLMNNKVALPQEAHSSCPLPSALIESRESEGWKRAGERSSWLDTSLPSLN